MDLLRRPKKHEGVDLLKKRVFNKSSSMISKTP
jgi:hypothetical protein